jgi:hypothetical protein
VRGAAQKPTGSRKFGDNTTGLLAAHTVLGRLSSVRTQDQQKPCSATECLALPRLPRRDGDYEIRGRFVICGRSKVSRIWGRRVCERRGAEQTSLIRGQIESVAA